MWRRIADRLLGVLLLAPAAVLAVGYALGILSARQFLDYSEGMFAAAGRLVHGAQS